MFMNAAGLQVAKGVAFVLILTLCYGLILRRCNKNSRQGQILLGILFGTVCSLSIIFPFHTPHGIAFDAQSIILGLATLLGGPIAALISAGLSAIDPLITNNSVLYTSFLSTVPILLGLLFRYLTDRHLIRLHVGSLLLFCLLVQGATLSAYGLLAEPHTHAEIRSLAQVSVATMVPAGALLGLMLRDIESLLQFEADLISSGERYRALYNDAPVMMYSLDASGVIVDVNDFWLHTLGYDRKAVIGHKASEFIAQESMNASFHDYDEKFISKEEIRDASYRFLTSDGRFVDVLLDATIDRDNTGALRGTRAVMSNISEKREREEALKNAQKMEAVGQLAGGLAHDFNNLLTVIIGNAELIETATKTNAKVGPRLARLRSAAQRGQSLVKRLLAFSRRQSLANAPTDINDLIRNLSDMIRATLGESISLKVQLDAALRPAMVDANQLEHALINILLNARDAMPEGGELTIITDNAAVTDEDAYRLSDLKAGSYVRLRIRDTGQGMPAEVIGHAFDPFFTTKEPGQGTGLGLSMVYGFIRQSGGHVALSSVPGHGTDVTIFLPEAAPGKEILPKSEMNRESPLPSGGNESILLVEDDEAVREVPVSILQSAGYRVTAVSNGPEALKALSLRAHFDLLFTDIVLPHGMNGGKVAEELRVRDPEMRVLYTTGYAKDEQTLPVPGKILYKPYEPAALLRTVREVLERPTPSSL